MLRKKKSQRQLPKELSSRSASPNSSLENIGVHAIVVPKFKLIDVEQKLLARDFMEGSNNAALHDTPEAFNSVGVNCTEHILAQTVPHEAMREVFIKVAIPAIFNLKALVGAVLRPIYFSAL